MKGIILFGHGSRDPLWRLSLESVADRVRASSAQAMVSCAYLELCEPDLPSAVVEMIAAGATSLRILPMFLGSGRHVRDDLPVLVHEIRQAYPDIQVELLKPVGEDPRVIQLLAEISLGSAA